MGLLDFVKGAGEKLFGGKDDKADNAAKAKSLTDLVTGMGMKVENLKVDFDDDVATIHGKVASQEEKEKLVLMIGNTQGVSQVDDRITVEKPEPQATMYTVQPGDSLSKIAKAHYGDAMKYPVIFEANRPMLKNPDRIYPGQVLRIPPQA